MYLPQELCFEPFIVH